MHQLMDRTNAVQDTRAQQRNAGLPVKQIILCPLMYVKQHLQSCQTIWLQDNHLEYLYSILFLHPYCTVTITTTARAGTVALQ